MSVLGFAGIFALILVIMALGSSISRTNANNNYPVFNFHAVIVSKQKNEEAYMIKFRFDNGDDIELMVYESDAENLEDGKEGTLTYRGTEFISFK